MPPWLQQILVAFGAFVGGRAVSTVGERMKEARDLRRSVDRLTLAVEQVPQQIGSLQGEIHRVGARNEAQLQALRDELHSHKLEQEKRFDTLEHRIDATAGRVDGLAAPQTMRLEPRISMRLDQERRCYKPPMGDAAQDR